MLKKLTDKLFGTNKAGLRPKSGTPSPASLENVSVLERSDHCISRKDISKNALKVLYTLRDANFDAYLVGGGVRDLLLAGKPKDFDIATNATPEDLKREFRNARIIGRRFKIVHIRFGREIIEVTTFRAPHENTNEFANSVTRKQIRNLDSAHSSEGMILRDNVYGNIDEDAMRRDFTINALYYTINEFKILDFANGVEDLDKRLVRMIGDPHSRYQEDPVRMLRAIRIAAKLDFDIEKNTRSPINELSHLLGSISPARLFDEVVKLLSAGYGVKTFALLRQFDIANYLFPATIKIIENQDNANTRLVELALVNTDARLAQGKSITPAFLFAALLWPVLQEKLEQTESCEKGKLPQFYAIVDEVIRQQLDYTSIPKRFSIAAREIWGLQTRLVRTDRKSIFSAYSHPRFRAGYDFLLLREQAGENLGGKGEWWTTFQISDTKVQEEMVKALAPARKPRRRKSQHKRNTTQDSNNNTQDSGRNDKP